MMTAISFGVEQNFQIHWIGQRERLLETSESTIKARRFPMSSATSDGWVPSVCKKRYA
jgi:hypothetical protein